MDTSFARLVIPREFLDALVAHARQERPNECCGVLAGTIENGVGFTARQFPVRNDLASPTAYRTNVADLFAVSKAVRAAGLEWLAIYHSHPASEPIPSKTDLANNTYGEAIVHLIVGWKGALPEVRGWRLGETTYHEVPWGDSPDPASEAGSNASSDDAAG